jgi:hypothetical protein
MRVLDMWSLVLNLVGGTFKDWLASRQEIDKARALARIENVKSGIPGYSDEYLVLIWSYPFVASFIPALQPSVEAGFKFMERMPEWYIAGWITVSFAVFGIDKLFKINWASFKKK